MWSMLAKRFFHRDCRRPDLCHQTSSRTTNDLIPLDIRDFHTRPVSYCTEYLRFEVVLVLSPIWLQPGWRRKVPPGRRSTASEDFLTSPSVHLISTAANSADTNAPLAPNVSSHCRMPLRKQQFQSALISFSERMVYDLQACPCLIWRSRISDMMLHLFL
jgi:hypothetical protein